MAAGEFYFNIYKSFRSIRRGPAKFFIAKTGVTQELAIKPGYQTEEYGRVEAGPLVQRSIINQQHDVRYIKLLQVNWSYNF